MLRQEPRAILDYAVEDVGDDVAVANGVDPDAVPDGLECQGASQLSQRALGGGVARLATASSASGTRLVPFK